MTRLSELSTHTGDAGPLGDAQAHPHALGALTGVKFRQKSGTIPFRSNSQMRVSEMQSADLISEPLFLLTIGEDPHALKKSSRVRLHGKFCRESPSLSLIVNSVRS